MFLWGVLIDKCNLRNSGGAKKKSISLFCGIGEVGSVEEQRCRKWGSRSCPGQPCKSQLDCRVSVVRKVLFSVATVLLAKTVLIAYQFKHLQAWSSSRIALPWHGCVKHQLLVIILLDKMVLRSLHLSFLRVWFWRLLLLCVTDILLDKLHTEKHVCGN
jgi:hypothetical protein